jgi:glycosyltransferase involved in cell wall biosynthesis
MRICHVTPHLPPARSASAQLPSCLGHWARRAGDEVVYISHRHHDALQERPPGDVLWIRSRSERMRGGQSKQVASLAEALRIWRHARPWLRGADLVHVHGRGLLAELTGLLARTMKKPVVLSLYGAEVWHYRRTRFPDLFGRIYRAATQVTFASRGLLEHAQALGLSRAGLRVIPPAIPEDITCPDRDAQLALRHTLGLDEAPLIVNAKDLHPLARHRDLVDAMPLVRRERPDAGLIIFGTGPLRAEIQAQVQGLGLADHVRLAGLADTHTVSRFSAAADLFVLPSLLEACPVAALEALSAGTPIVSADSPGGVELGALFGADVTVVPARAPAQLAQAILAGLAQPRRAGPGTRAVLEHHFRPAVVEGAFQRVYADALEAHHGRSARE